MNNSEKKQSSIIPVMGMLALIVVLFIGIKLVFAGMEAVLPQKQQSGSQSTAQSSQMEEQQESNAPAFCPFCGETLYEGFQWGQYCPYCGEKIEG